VVIHQVVVLQVVVLQEEAAGSNFATNHRRIS
jgi:hypothetical protein